MKSRTLIAAAIALVLSAGLATAQFTNNFQPAAQPAVIGNTDLVPIAPNGVPGPNQQYASALALAGYAGGLPTKGNLLIGGDASTNLFQRATSGASVTTTVTYGGPDRWAYWSGTNTAMTVSQDTTAADLRPGVKAAFKMARTSGQTGIVPMCKVQPIESINVYQLQGQTVEFDFEAVTGANFSPASGNVTAYVITGTGTDQGVLTGANSVAFGLNGGGGGSGGWTGQANATAAVISLGGPGTSGRYAAVATIPATATEAAVALCMTPVGTAGTNDYVALQNLQLVRNASLAGKVSTTLGYSCDNIANTQINCSAFDRSRNAAQEALLQQRYFYNVSEGAAIQTRGICFNSDTTHANCMLNTPVPMRAAPTFTGDGGFTAGFAVPTTTAGTTLGNCSAVALSAIVASTVASTNNFVVTCTASTVPAAGTVGFLYDNNGSGRIKATAEL